MKRFVAIAAVGVMMALPSVALAGSSSSTSQAYQNQTTQAKKVLAAHASRKPGSTSPASVQNSPNSGVRSASTGSLPFTGLDIGALAGGAVLLLGAGLLLRRVSANDRR